ncbi:MAG: hypothetical protein RL563_1969 [Pseudomonadota bacterium]
MALAPGPYVRLFRRIRRYFIEKNRTKNSTSGRQLLDQLYKHLKKQEANASLNMDLEHEAYQPKQGC